MKLKRILATVLALAMVLSTMGIVSFADNTSTITLNAFVDLLKAGNGVYDGDGVTVKFTANEADTTYYNKPDTFNQAGGAVVQYYGLFGEFTGWVSNSLKDLTISNVNFVFDNTDCINTQFATDITTAEFTLWSVGDIVFDNCSFDKVCVDCAAGMGTDGLPNSATFSGCRFTNIKNRNGIHQCQAKNIVITDCKFENSDKAIHFNSGELESIVISNNDFINVGNGQDSLITVGERNDFSTATLSMENNEVSYDDGAVMANGVVNLYYNNSLPIFDVVALEEDNNFGDLNAVKAFGTITYGFASQTGVWGEGTANATKSFVVELYADDEKIAQASLNDYNDLIDGDIYVTWSIPFNGEDSNEWDVEWYGRNPSVATVPTKVVLVVDGVAVAENEVQMNGPDNINPVEWNKLEGIPAAAKIGDTKYATLDAAIAAAQDGDVITVLGIVEENVTITKNGITLEGVLNNAGVASYNNTGVSKLAKAAEKSDYVSAIYGTIDATAAKDVTIKNLYVDADGENAISIRDGLVENVMVEDAWKAFVLSYAKADDHVDIKNCTVIDTVYVAHNDEASETTTYTFENNYFKSSFGITMGKSGLITVAGNTIIHDSEAYPNYDYGILRHFNAPIKAYENTLIGVKYSKKVAETVGEVYKNYFSLGIENAEETDKKVEIPSYYLDENRTMLYIADKKLVDATVATKASIAFERVEDGDDYVIYDMAIKADDNAIINLVSAQMKFTLDDLAVKANGMSVAYEISGANGFVVSQDSVTGKYLFNLPEGTNETIGKKSGESVVIGRIKITGYTHKVNDPEVKAIVNVTEGFYNYKDINDSIAEVEMPITDSPLEHSKTVASQKLIINVRFPNSIRDNASAYQDMKVEITGGDLNESVKFVLGSDKYAHNDEEAYEVEQMLTKDTTYTVTVSGAGYRTARYTVTMTEDKTINFWNNVMDNETVVEEDKHSETKNFLAGDIVKDNKINIYDLSAVVSYFGTENLVAEHPEYAKYDLNRDGVIDSKDVAYVLVSWGE